MSTTDDEPQPPRRPSRPGEPDLGVITPPSIPRIEVPGVPAPRSRRRRSEAVQQPAVRRPDSPSGSPGRLPDGRLPGGLVAPSALELRNRAARTGRRYLLLAALCLTGIGSADLPAAGRWLLVALLAAGALRVAQTWRRAFGRRRAERLLGHPTWPGAEDLARP
jgi:hypothetical protein